ncbi:hypothetical protein N7456_003686 [Penicillium angulare]|uniref:Carrier domain-containing protein n=1 Tax=Penicillium angulare TaxID=116970 RepID=A0A9W9KIG8_9EURO|nr:hypothetical protein N7456_003686 [Penicillium angulare]
MGSIVDFQKSLVRTTEQVAKSDPERLFCVQSVTPDLSQGWRDISFADVARAANRMALWIRENVTSSNQSETLAFVGTNDIRYVAFILACMKLRHKPLLLSTRNSVVASQHLLASTGSTKMVYTTERSRQINDIAVVDSTIGFWEVPSLWEIFDKNGETPDIEEQGEDSEDRIALYIHSSGTTGLPKPVPITNGYLLSMEQTGFLPAPESKTSGLFMWTQGLRAITMGPFFHLMGLIGMTAPIFFSTPFVLVPDRPLTVELFAQIMEDQKPQTGIFIPSVLESLARSELGTEYLRKFHSIIFGGAPLASEIGDHVAGLTHLQISFGSSECGMFASVKTEEKEDWNYFQPNPNAGIVMQEAGDGLFELVVIRSEGRVAQGAFHTSPDQQEYRTGDLFVRHQQKDNLWHYSGRRDDLIVLSNGEKFNPTTMEEIISGHHIVNRAIVIGQGRFQPSVLIEPDWSIWSSEPHELINQVWSTIEQANRTAPGHAQLMKSHVAISLQSKPFQLTPKGTVKRGPTLVDYGDEINNIYERVDLPDVAQLAQDATKSDITAHITAIISEVSPVPIVDENADIFALGIDSLQTLNLGQSLRASLQSVKGDFAAAFDSPQLYSRPTVRQLSEYVYGLLQGHDPSPLEDFAESDSDREARLANLVGKYTDDLGESHAVILTGSTGSLGAYLLSELLRDLTVTKIYCLNRSEDAGERQLQSLQDKGLAFFKQFPQRVEFLHVNFQAERLGLEDSKYEELLQSVDTVIHNAWKVNFNHRVEAFEEPHIAGVRRLIELSISSERTAHIHFISSISTIEGSSLAQGPSIPEIIFNDPSTTLRQGYGESKHVSERICAAASARAGVPTTIHRVGQIGGPTTEKGMWNKQEWLPSLVATSKALKQIPKSLESISVQWVPVDTTAKVITETMRARRITQDEEPCAVFHIVNPKTADWSSLIPAVTKYFDAEPVDFKTWLDTLASFTNPTQKDLQDKPALKLLSFFQGTVAAEVGPWIETVKTQAASKTLRELKAIDAPLVENWMNQWKF